MYAVVQDGCAIFGVGRTRRSAIADARKWTDNLEPSEIYDMPSSGAVLGEFYVAPCTKALAERVLISGGQIKYATRNDGTLCLPSEV